MKIFIHDYKFIFSFSYVNLCFITWSFTIRYKCIYDYYAFQKKWLFLLGGNLLRNIPNTTFY